ncbi:hypothetical protein GGH99_008161, partial [Coemansia sp. RSA 1285]
VAAAARPRVNDRGEPIAPESAAGALSTRPDKHHKKKRAGKRRGGVGNGGATAAAATGGDNDGDFY